MESLRKGIVCWNKDKFKYYESQIDKSHKGVINFDQVEASVFVIPDKTTCFKITWKGQSKEFVFKAESDEEALEWVNKIEECINS